MQRLDGIIDRCREDFAQRHSQHPGTHRMKISIFGLGYVGAVSLACLSRDGHEVIGVDIDRTKLDLIAAGKTPVVEEGMVDLMQQVAASGRVSVTTDTARRPCWAARSRWSASARRRRPTAARTRARSCAWPRRWARRWPRRRAPHVVVFRSTLVPGTVEDVLRPIIEQHSGKKDGVDFHLCFQPEFLREGSSIRDYDKPPFTIVGANHAVAGRAPAGAVRPPAVQVHRDLGAQRRDDEVLLQQLPRAEDHLRQRDRAAVRRARRRRRSR